MDDVSVPFPPKTIALQVDKFQYVPSALWVKNDWGALAWSRIWPAEGSTIDDHEVKATSTDTTHGALTDELEAAGILTKDIHVVGGKPLVRLTGTMALTSALPLQDGIASAGDLASGEAAAKDHVHPAAPAPDPAIVASRLYPTVVLSNKQIQAKCVMAPIDRWLRADMVLVGPEYCGASFPFDNWMQGPAGTWTRDPLGPIPSAITDGISAAVVGMRLFAGATGCATAYLPHCGIYEVLVLGDGYNHAVIRRVTDADASGDFTYGKPVWIAAGDMWGSYTFRYSGSTSPTIGTTDLTFNNSGPYSAYATGFFGIGGPNSGRWHATGGLFTWGAGGETMGLGNPTPPVPCVGLAADGSATIPINVGDKFFIWVETDTYGESAHFGLYELLSIDGYGNRTIRRVATANTPSTLTGLTVAITGSGVAHEGNQFVETATIATVDTTATDWAEEAIILDAAYELLLQSQFTSEGIDRALHSRGGFATAATSPHALGDPFATTVGVPGLSTLPVGRYTARIRANATGGDTGATATVTAALSVIPSGWAPGDSVPTPFVTLTSPPLSSGTGDQYFEFQADTTSTTSGADRLAVQWKCLSTSTTNQLVTLTYFDANLSTWIEVPFTMAVAGSADGDHQHQSRRDQDVASTDPVKADPCHPWNSLGPLGRVHMGIPAAALTGTGTTRRIAMPANASQAKVTPTTSEVVYGIDPTGFLEGDPVKVAIYATPTNTVTLVHLDTTSSQMFLDGVTKNITCSKTTILKFMRLDDLWRRE
jgi:hypothetical protein